MEDTKQARFEELKKKREQGALGEAEEDEYQKLAQEPERTQNKQK